MGNMFHISQLFALALNAEENRIMFVINKEGDSQRWRSTNLAAIYFMSVPSLQKLHKMSPQ
jgi:hypothetical protein